MWWNVRNGSECYCHMCCVRSVMRRGPQETIINVTTQINCGHTVRRHCHSGQRVTATHKTNQLRSCNSHLVYRCDKRAQLRSQLYSYGYKPHCCLVRGKASVYTKNYLQIFRPRSRWKRNFIHLSKHRLKL